MHLPFFHIMYSSIHLPIHASKEREFNINVPWGYSWKRMRPTDAIKGKKRSMSGGWMSRQHRASWPTARQYHSHTRTWSRLPALSCLWKTETNFLLDASTFYGCSTRGRETTVSGCLHDIHESDTWQEICIWTCINTPSITNKTTMAMPYKGRETECCDLSRNVWKNEKNREKWYGWASLTQF